MLQQTRNFTPGFYSFFFIKFLKIQGFEMTVNFFSAGMHIYAI